MEALTRWSARLAGVGVLVGLLAAPAPAAADRYSIVHGCYTVESSSGTPLTSAQRVRLQPTDLGSYMLYRPGGTFVAAQPDGSTGVDGQPSPAADWVVTDGPGSTFSLSPKSNPQSVLIIASDGAGHLSDRAAAGAGAHLRLVPATGCADFPEAELDATGSPAASDISYGQVGGLLEGHMHWMTYEFLGGRFHCGRPWSPYGIQYALPDCSSIEGPQGSTAVTQNFLNFGSPIYPHDTSGYPKLTEWGASNLTYEGTYWRWIQRAWLGGLRLMVMGINENRILCQLEPNHATNCNEMDTVRRGLQDMRDLQRYVDAQAGGPGKGFFQIVTDPYQARRVINQGRMAVVLEMEVSEPFDCSGWDKPSCDTAQVDRGLDELYRLGVRSSLLLNKFDNPLTGVRFDDGPVGVLINGGNKLSAGSYWSARTCPGPLHDNEIYGPSGPLGNLANSLGVPGGAPTYPPPPHCNTRGLTDLGRHVVDRMMALHMIVNPDHMSQAGVDATLHELETRRYSGVISPHGWMDPGNWPRLWKLGGLAFPGHSAAENYVSDWRRYRPRSTPFMLGWGYGADLGGLSHQPVASARTGFTYPFTSPDGRVTFTRQRTGDRTFDYAKEGVAHYGLYADWFADLRRQGGSALGQDMWNGSEAYLQMWERADGIRPTACTPARRTLGASGYDTIRLGADWTALLRAAGQPQQRTRTWSWCVQGKANARAADVAVLTRAGTVELVGSRALGRRAGRISVGQWGRRVVRGTTYIARGLRILPHGRVTWVYVLRRRRIVAVAVMPTAAARRRATLRYDVDQLIAARAVQARPTFVPSAAQAATRGALTGRPLAATGNPGLDRALLLLCHLQVSAPSG